MAADCKSFYKTFSWRIRCLPPFGFINLRLSQDSSPDLDFSTISSISVFYDLPYFSGCSNVSYFGSYLNQSDSFTSWPIDFFILFSTDLH